MFSLNFGGYVLGVTFWFVWGQDRPKTRSLVTRGYTAVTRGELDLLRRWSSRFTCGGMVNLLGERDSKTRVRIHLASPGLCVYR